MCFVWIWEQKAIISLYSINWLVCITETECVYCAVRPGSLYIIQVMCFVSISEQTAIISLYSINWLVCIAETECVYCAVRTGSLYIIRVMCFVWIWEQTATLYTVNWLVLGVFANFQKATISCVTSVRLSEWDNSAPAGRIIVKFCFWVFLENLLSISGFIKLWQQYGIFHTNTNIHFCSYLAHFFPEWEMFQTNVENIKTHILCSTTFPPKIVPFMR